MSILTQIRRPKSGAPGRIARCFGRQLCRVVDFLLTQDCLLCAAASDGEILCSACAADLPRLSARICPRCALPTPQGEVCGRCLAHPPAFDTTLAAYRYDFPVDKLIQSLKYGHRLALAPYFGRQLTALAAPLAADVIVPLPLHRERLRQRGFNQALELARPVARACRLPIDASSCQRTRNTPAQAELGLRERAANVRNAFDCSATFGGKRVILIDDVMTTGASLDECAGTLKRHGAVRVDVLVLARALPRPG